MIQQIAFGVLALVALGGAVGVVAARSVFVSALWLILSFAGVAGLYVLLEAGFLGAIQILIYIGAISVLILFAVMLTRHVMEHESLTNGQWVLGLIVSLSVFAVLAILAYRADWPLRPGAVVPSAGGEVVGPAAEGEPAFVVGAVRRPVTAGGVTREAEFVPGTVEAIGRGFMGPHLLAFEVASIILLVALMGAIVVARD